MIYYSEIKGKKVFTEKNTYLGKLRDLTFLAQDTPRITKLFVQTSPKEFLFIPVEYLKKINDNFTVSKDFQKSQYETGELFINKNLLDKQIIDIGGNKIVRVNDVVIQDKPFLCISGVDIGALGLFRRLGFEHRLVKFHALMRIKLSSKFLSWGDVQPLELARGHVKLKKKEEKLERIRPEDLADYLEKTTILNTRKILGILDEKTAARVIGDLNINYQVHLFEHFNPGKSAKIISSIDPDEAVDILLALSIKKKEQIIEQLPEEKKKEIVFLLKLSPTPIGEFVTPEFLTVDAKDTVGEIIQKIRKETADFSFFDYVYVVNEKKELTGVFNLHELLMQKQETSAYKFMIQNLVVVHLTTPEEIAIKKMLKYQVHALPVIDKEKHILGIVTYDNIAGFLLKKLR